MDAEDKLGFIGCLAIFLIVFHIWPEGQLFLLCLFAAGGMILAFIHSRLILLKKIKEVTYGIYWRIISSIYHRWRSRRGSNLPVFSGEKITQH